MALCYQLVKDGKPALLEDVDAQMCKAFGREVDPHKWLLDWHGIIGLQLAAGLTWDEIRENLRKRLQEAQETSVRIWNKHQGEGEDLYSALNYEMMILGLISIAYWLETNYEVLRWRE